MGSKEEIIADLRSRRDSAKARASDYQAQVDKAKANIAKDTEWLDHSSQRKSKAILAAMSLTRELKKLGVHD